MSTPKLFQPVKVGDMQLTHRIVLAPLGRLRANLSHVHGDLAVEYYSQRASVPGSLLITEATIIAPRAGNLSHMPGIWNEDQIEAWKRVTDAVHAKGSYIYVQLWALGRATLVEELEKEDPSFPYVSASDVQLTGRPKPPRPLSVTEIKEYIDFYATAASNAVYGAGFDGVEIHGANGYLIDQFLQDVSNKRTDEYGGSLANRCRFALEVVDAVVDAIGESKTAIRFSPWSDFQDMRMEDPVPTFSYVMTRLSELHPSLAYIHLIEPRAKADVDRIALAGESNAVFRRIWAPRPLITAGGYNREDAIKVAETEGDLIAFGRAYIANPDLPLRLAKDIPLTIGNRSTYYIHESPIGYTDYTFAQTSKDVAHIEM